MNWTPVFAVVIGLLVAFDAYRAFDRGGFWGQPWPRADRRENPSLFWIIQALRIIASVGLVVIGTLWLRQLDPGQSAPQ